jgi:hypothetical protein
VGVERDEAHGAYPTTPAGEKYDIVLDVPPDAKIVNYGAVQSGPGTTWIDLLD